MLRVRSLPPHLVLAVGVEAAGHRGPPGLAPDEQGRDRALGVLGAVLVRALAEDHGLSRCSESVRDDGGVDLRPLGPGLDHVEVEPVLAVEELGRGAPAARVVGDEVGAAVALAQAACELAEDVLEAGGGAVAAVHPHDVGRGLVPGAEPAAVGSGVAGVEDRDLLHVVAPGREHREDEALAVGVVDEVVDVLEIGRIGLRRIVVDPRLLALRVGDRGLLLHAAAVAPGEDALDDGEALGGPVRQVGLGLLLGVLRNRAQV